MPLPPHVVADLAAAGLPTEHDVPLDRLVSWRVGGPADALVTVDTEEGLRRLVDLATQHDVPLFVLGAGSNLLVADDGIEGIVARLTGTLTGAVADGRRLTVGGGLRLPVLLNRALKQGWAGLEALAGIPGTVGGAVAMNAGTSLGAIGDLIASVRVVRPGGAHTVLTKADLAPRYRHTDLPAGAIVTGATLCLGDDPEGSALRSRAFLDRRKATQPLDLPSCGSTFTNPPGDAAGRLIEAAGLKGVAIGGAMVSPKHANFLVNTGEATAADLRALISHVQRTVAERLGVALTPEVRLVGRWPA